jgi:uncharacterized RDD family membrane protein YckC
MIYRCMFLAAAVWLCGWAPAVEAQDWSPDRVWVTGSDASVWVVASGDAPEEQLPVIEFWYAGSGRTDTGLEKPSQSAALVAQLGEVERLGADALVLRVLFSNLESANYAGESGSLGGVLWTQQSDAPPAAWGGDAAVGVFYAVAETSQLKAPTQPATTSPVTQPAEDDTADATAAESAAIESRMTCLRLRDGKWERLACPPESDTAEAFWITGRRAAPYLFWQSADGLIYFSMNEGSAWTPPEQVCEQIEFSFARVGVGKAGPVLVAATPAGDSSVNLQLYQREDETWRDMSAAREGSELFAGDPEKIDVAIARDQLVVGRLGEEGRIEFGSGALGVSPPLAFDELRIKAPVQTTPAWQDILLMVLVLTCVTALFWSRRELAAHPLALPPGWMLAATWKRMLAALIDFLPALLLSTMLIAFYLGDRIPQDPSAVLQMFNDPEFVRASLPIALATWSAYALWCFAWEILTATTPGKRLFGCRVFGVDGSRPGFRAVALRNISRGVMLALGDVGILVILMTMIFLTRNRQRPGDLLAKTLVLEPRPEGYDTNGRRMPDDRQEPPRE